MKNFEDHVEIKCLSMLFRVILWDVLLSIFWGGYPINQSINQNINSHLPPPTIYNFISRLVHNNGAEANINFSILPLSLVKVQIESPPQMLNHSETHQTTEAKHILNALSCGPPWLHHVKYTMYSTINLSLITFHSFHLKGCAMSGLIADAKTLIDKARVETQVS